MSGEPLTTIGALPDAMGASEIADGCRCSGDTACPSWIPRALRRYGEDRSRADGSLTLTLAPRAGSTRLIHVAHRMPLMVQRVQYLDPAAPAMAFVTVLAVGGGVLGGDRLVQHIRLERGAQAHVTTQAATKLYRMPLGYASSETVLLVDAGAVLEYLPLPVIAQAGARWATRTTVVAAPGATVLLGDVFVPGRLARGEVGQFDAVALLTEGRTTLVGEPVWRDALVIVPEHLPPGAAHATIGTLIVCTDREPAQDLADTLFPLLDALCAAAGVDGGISELPGNGGVMIRIVGNESRAVQAAHREAWALVRRRVLGLGLPPLRRL